MTSPSDLRRRVVAALAEYGPMTIPELVVALDTTRSRVATALNTTPEVKRVGGIGYNPNPYRYGVVNTRRVRNARKTVDAGGRA